MAERTELMGHPLELRELIWRYAVVEDEPLVSYVGVRTVRRQSQLCQVPGIAEECFLHSRLVRQTKAYSELPPLALVSKNVRLETLGIYFSENVFEFRLGGAAASPYEVQQWLDIHWHGSPGDNHSARMINKLSSINLDFDLYSSSIERKVAAGLCVLADLPGGDIHPEATGILNEECLCNVIALVRFIAKDTIVGPEAWPRWQIVAFGTIAHQLEEELVDWQWPNRLTPREECATCKKLCYMNNLLTSDGNLKERA